MIDLGLQTISIEHLQMTPTMQSGFRDLIVWQKSMDLVIEVYRCARSLPAEERFGLTSQMQRAAVSVAANIAEGHGRTTRGEFGNHLSIARGSLKELETLILIARRLAFVSDENGINLLSRSEEISKMLTVLKRRMVR